MTLVYPLRNLIGDYVRSVFGSTVAVVVATQVSPDSIVFYFVALVCVLFVGLAVQTWQRSRTRIVLHDSGIEMQPAGRVVLWSHLKACKLSYFSTRRDRRNGWMQLTVSSGDNVIRIDSRLEGFAELVRQVELAARSSTVELSSTSLINFEAFH